MITEMKKQIENMDPEYKKVYRDLIRAETVMGGKDLYFILKRYYENFSQETVYKPTFKI